MATFNTTQYTAQLESRANKARLAEKNVASGSVEFAVIPYTLAATEAATDVINLMLLPAGAIPMPALSSIVCQTDPGTALTFDIGTAADVDGWGDGVALTDKGKVEFTATAHTQPAWNTQTPAVADTGSGNAIVKATVMTATSLTATTVVTFILAYKLGR
jgi:hypothetical protein